MNRAFYYFFSFYILNTASLVAQMVKTPPAMWETWVQFLGWEEPLEKGTAFHSNALAWRIPWTEKPGRLPSVGLQRVRCDWATFIHTRTHTFISIRSDQISHSVMSDSLQPHESQHARPPYPSPTPGVHSDSHPSSQWCHPAISSSVVPSPLAPNPSQHQSQSNYIYDTIDL